MKSHFSCFALAIFLSVIFSASNRPVDNSQLTIRAGEWVQVSSAPTFSAEVRTANIKLETSGASAHQIWDCHIFGQVRDARGPVAGVRVTLTGRAQQSVVTDQEGRYRFENLQPGSYQIKFSAPGRIRQTRRITLEGTATPEGLRGEKKRLNISLASVPSATPSPLPSATAVPSPSSVPSPTPATSPSPRPSAQPSPTGNSNQGHTNVNVNTSINTNANVNANTGSLSVDQQIEALVKGKIVYDIPAIMRLGTVSVIKVGIAKGITPDVAARQQKDENTIVGDLPVADVMDVDLISEEAGAFVILRQQPRAELPGWQLIGGDTASEWIFNVTPRQSGTHKLRLVASVRLSDPKYQNQAKSFKVYENDISVSTNYFYHATEFIKGYWQFLLTTLLLPAAAIGWRFLKGKRKPNNDE